MYVVTVVRHWAAMAVAKCSSPLTPHHAFSIRQFNRAFRDELQLRQGVLDETFSRRLHPCGDFVFLLPEREAITELSLELEISTRRWPVVPLVFKYSCTLL